MNISNQTGLIFLGFFLALGLTGGGYFVGQTMYNSQVAVNTAEAMGLAERQVEANRASWSVGFSVVGASKEEVPELYKLMERNQKTIKDILVANGFSDDEIQTGLIDYDYREIRNSQRKLIEEQHVLNSSISLETDDVHKVAKAREEVNGLIAKGVNIKNYPPRYMFTQLNDIKPDMLKEAARNARIAAAEFANNAGVEVGRIRSARQGRFEIQDAGADYGSTNKIEKDVRVVTTISFYLTD